MARYCSAQESARTRWSPSYRETIFVNVVQGTKSMSCANSVLPAYMAVSAVKSARLCPQPIQVDTAHFWPETRAIRGFQSFAPSVNRTVVGLGSELFFSTPARISHVSGVRLSIRLRKT